MSSSMSSSKAFSHALVTTTTTGPVTTTDVVTTTDASPPTVTTTTPLPWPDMGAVPRQFLAAPTTSPMRLHPTAMVPRGPPRGTPRGPPPRPTVKPSPKAKIWIEHYLHDNGLTDTFTVQEVCERMLRCYVDVDYNLRRREGLVPSMPIRKMPGSRHEFMVLFKFDALRAAMEYLLPFDDEDGSSLLEVTDSESDIDADTGDSDATVLARAMKMSVEPATPEVVDLTDEPTFWDRHVVGAPHRYVEAVAAAQPPLFVGMALGGGAGGGKKGKKDRKKSKGGDPDEDVLAAMGKSAGSPAAVESKKEPESAPTVITPDDLFNVHLKLPGLVGCGEDLHKLFPTVKELLARSAKPGFRNKLKDQGASKDQAKAIAEALRDDTVRASLAGIRFEGEPEPESDSESESESEAEEEEKKGAGTEADPIVISELDVAAKIKHVCPGCGLDRPRSGGSAAFKRIDIHFRTCKDYKALVAICGSLPLTPTPAAPYVPGKWYSHTYVATVTGRKRLVHHKFKVKGMEVVAGPAGDCAGITLKGLPCSRKASRQTAKGYPSCYQEHKRYGRQCKDCEAVMSIKEHTANGGQCFDCKYPDL